MRFHFSTINHNTAGRATLGDMFAWFEAGLVELGHAVTSGTNLDRGAINVLWENFRPGMGTALEESGLTYGIVATEFPDGAGGFNWRSDDPWPTRYAAFAEVAKGASFIWSMIEEPCEFYGSFAPCAFMELGFSEKLVPPPRILNATTEFDFGFFGLRTPYREAAIGRLRKYCSVSWPQFMQTEREVLEFIGSARAGLNFRQSENWPIPSPTRLGRYLHGKRLLISESTRTPTRQGEIVSMAPPGVDFVDHCMEKLNAGWRGEAEAAFERYRREMPMRRIMEHVLEKTVADVRVSRWGLRRSFGSRILSLEPTDAIHNRNKYIRGFLDFFDKQNSRNPRKD